MPRRRPDDDDDYDDEPPRRRRRRVETRSNTALYIGLGVAVVGVVLGVVVVVVLSRGGSSEREEKVTEDGVRVITVRARDGSASATQYLPPADGRPYGMRHNQDGLRPDRSALTEGWGLIRGRWERTDEAGQVHVAEFRPDHTATVTLRFAEGLKTAEYELSSLCDNTELVPSIKTYRRRFDMELRPAGEKDKTVSFQCGIRPDGSLWAGYNEMLQYRRVR